MAPIAACTLLISSSGTESVKPTSLQSVVHAMSLANFDQLGDPVAVSALGEPHGFTRRLLESRVTLAQNLSANALKARVTSAQALSPI